MNIYQTDSQNIAEELYLHNIEEEEIDLTIREIYELLNLGMIQGATLIGHTIIADKIASDVFKEDYGIEMFELNLHRLSV